MSDQSLLQMAHSCPRCHRGPLFSGFVALNTTCNECGLPFESETGQTWGAMVLAYAFSGVIAIPIFLLLLVNRFSALYALAIPVTVLTVISPLNVRVSRLLWTHAMYYLHNSKQT